LKKRKADRTIEVQNAKARKIEEAIILAQKKKTKLFQNYYFFLKTLSCYSYAS
jgi:hypothetical protein